MALLLFDIGNTNIKIGLYRRESGLSSYVLPTPRSSTADQLGLDLAALLAREALAPDSLDAILAISVVPPVNPMLRQACNRFIGRPLHFVPEDIPVPLANLYERPEQVGADRLVAAYAARRAASTHCVVSVDFGTATTFDVVRGQSYLGGLICPGVLSSARALAQDTAKLPQIDLEPESLKLSIGRSTVESLNQGLLFGFASLVEGILDRLEDHLGEPVTVISTGGFAPQLARVCPAIANVRPELLLDGLRLVYEEVAAPAARRRT
ncbi:type III pantothenate kinase [Fundidesulfovibrio soli]|uniref:type III pantothenate kinase n=1 Tax=Fundidesulfovibrio soli TaxID=2922716 RepID=UPI001FAFC458|nr:type III pantothenate kinase [Fundidesulfovibrio soli]